MVSKITVALNDLSEAQRTLPSVREVGGSLSRSSVAHPIRDSFSRLPVAWLAMNLTCILVGISSEPTVRVGFGKRASL